MPWLYITEHWSWEYMFIINTKFHYFNTVYFKKNPGKEWVILLLDNNVLVETLQSEGHAQGQLHHYKQI